MDNVTFNQQQSLDNEHLRLLSMIDELKGALSWHVGCRNNRWNNR